MRFRFVCLMRTLLYLRFSEMSFDVDRRLEKHLNSIDQLSEERHLKSKVFGSYAA